MADEKFLEALEKELYLLKEDERKDILRDFRETDNGRITVATAVLQEV